MANPRLISGIQPTGKLHIGNYLGALKNFVALQNSGKYECLFFIADLHSLTQEFDPAQKSGEITNLFADFLAAGLDVEKSLIFLQSRISEHAEAAWIFGTITPLGELERMTQFKDWSARKESPGLGLFSYPVLQAADILLYDAKFVPVGEDQLQHLELTRTLARKFNKKFGDILTEPKELLTETPRVMSLADPARKMAKSEPQGCVFLDDSPEEIRNKIKRAVTDSGDEIKSDWETKPAISNLLQIYASLSRKTVPELEKEFARASYAEFKTSLADLVADYFADFRKKKAGLMSDKEKLAETLRSGSEKAAKIASAKMGAIKKAVGLVI